MRAVPSVLSCCAAVLSLALAGAAAADAERVTPNLTVFSTEQTGSDDGQTTVLRGSATRRGTVDSSFVSAPAPLIPLGAGEDLWLADPESGDLVLCRERRTSRVGDRFIGCLSGYLPVDLGE